MPSPLPRSIDRLLLAGLIAGLGCIVGCSNQGPANGWTEYGNASPSATSVQLNGRIEEVCLTKGCWMKVRESDDQVTLVRFLDYGFFVPMNSTGHMVIAEGERRVQTFDQAQRRHLAVDAGASPEEIEAITGSTTTTVFIANGVQILGDGLDAPYAPATPEDCIVNEAPKGSDDE
ncbi:MAG: DUF4920 domain-containing protein [Phycisphaera sp.]|nr:DUF4920 domain-containing protein [Phycisphaera sp.]